MAPAAGPGWEEPTSQSYPKFLSGSDYVFTPRTSSVGGSAYDGLAFLRPLELYCHGTSDVPRRVASKAISLAADYSAHLSRYGVIRFDRTSTLTDKNHNLAWTGPPYGRTARSSVAPVCIRHPFGQRLLPEDVVHFEPISSVFVLPWIRRSALRSELCSWLFCPYSCLLKTAKLALP